MRNDVDVTNLIVQRDRWIQGPELIVRTLQWSLSLVYLKFLE